MSEIIEKAVSRVARARNMHTSSLSGEEMNLRAAARKFDAEIKDFRRRNLTLETADVDDLILELSRRGAVRGGIGKQRKDKSYEVNTFYGAALPAQDSIVLFVPPPPGEIDDGI